jgi:hypothetical protein
MVIASAPTTTLPPAQELWRVLPPGENTADVLVAEQCLSSALSLPPARRGWKRKQELREVTALELHAWHARVDFALRGTPAALQRTVGQLVAGYRQLDAEALAPERDPLVLHPGEAASSAVLHLAQPAALPLKTPHLHGGAPQVDPLVGFIHALAETPPTLRVVCQLIVTPAASGWARRYERLLGAQQDRRRLFQQRPDAIGNDLELGLLAALGVGVLALPFWLLHGLLLALWGLSLVSLTALGLGGGIWFLRAKRQEQLLLLHAPAVSDKLRRGAVRTCLRLYVLGPADEQARARWLRALLDRMSGAYAAENRLVVGRQGEIRPAQAPHPLRGQREREEMWRLERAFHPTLRRERFLLWLRGDRARPFLSTLELAAFYHFPQSMDDHPFLTLQSSRQRLPAPGVFTIAPVDVPPLAPADLADPVTWDAEVREKLKGVYMGTSRYGAQTLPVYFPWSMLDGHMGIVAGTGMGKSSLIKQMMRWAALDPHLAIVCADPHGDLQRDMRSLVAPHEIEQGRVVIIDPADDWPVGFPSLWEPALQHQADRQRVVSNVVHTMEQMSGEAWGKRVRANFVIGLTTLMQACAGDRARGGDAEVHTILDMYHLFTNPAFRASVLSRVTPGGRAETLQDAWFSQHDRLMPYQELQEVASLLNRILPMYFDSAGTLIGQRSPRFSLRDALWNHRICLLNLGSLGLESRSFVGSLFLSYLQGIVHEAGMVPMEERPHLLLVIDELQAFDPQAIIGLFGEIRKFGGRIIGATNSLEKIQRNHPELAAELNNIGTWVAGRLGGADATLMLQRLQGSLKGSLSERDLDTLPRLNFFVRAMVEGQPERPFRLALPPHPPRNTVLEDRALVVSREKYGRPLKDVEDDIDHYSTLYAPNRIKAQLQQRKQEQQKDKKNSQKAGKADQPAPEDAATAAEAEVRRTAQVKSEAAPGKRQASGTGRDSTSARTKKTHPRGGKAHTLHTTAFAQGERPGDDEEVSA